MSTVTSPSSRMYNSLSPPYEEIRIGAIEGVKLSTSLERLMLRAVSLGFAVEIICFKTSEATSAGCQAFGQCGKGNASFPYLFELLASPIVRDSKSLMKSVKKLKSRVV